MRNRHQTKYKQKFDHSSWKTSDFSDITSTQRVNDRSNLHLWKDQKSWPGRLVEPARGEGAEEAQKLWWSGQDGERRQR